MDHRANIFGLVSTGGRAVSLFGVSEGVRQTLWLAAWGAGTVVVTPAAVGLVLSLKNPEGARGAMD